MTLGIGSRLAHYEVTALIGEGGMGQVWRLPDRAGREQGQEGSMSVVRKAIDTSNQDFMARFAQQDAAGLASVYTAGGCVMPSNSDVIFGADSIRAFWQGVFDVGAKRAELETLDLEEHGDTAIETGRYTMKADGGVVADRGKYLVV